MRLQYRWKLRVTTCKSNVLIVYWFDYLTIFLSIEYHFCNKSIIIYKVLGSVCDSFSFFFSFRHCNSFSFFLYIEKACPLELVNWSIWHSVWMVHECFQLLLHCVHITRILLTYRKFLCSILFHQYRFVLNNHLPIDYCVRCCVLLLVRGGVFTDHCTNDKLLNLLFQMY